VREFLVEFSQDWIEELIEVRKDRRAAEGRLAEYKFAFARGELACYSDVISEAGGLASGGGHYGFFLSHAGHDYLIEDYYCPTPECDCRKVHIEFWERVESINPRHIDLRQVLMATFLRLPFRTMNAFTARQRPRTTTQPIQNGSPAISSSMKP
jgi:hypothetical protein